MADELRLKITDNFGQFPVSDVIVLKEPLRLFDPKDFPNPVGQNPFDSSYESQKERLLSEQSGMGQSFSDGQGRINRTAEEENKRDRKSAARFLQQVSMQDQVNEWLDREYRNYIDTQLDKVLAAQTPDEQRAIIEDMEQNLFEKMRKNPKFADMSDAELKDSIRNKIKADVEQMYADQGLSPEEIEAKVDAIYETYVESPDLAQMIADIEQKRALIEALEEADADVGYHHIGTSLQVEKSIRELEEQVAKLEEQIQDMGEGPAQEYMAWKLQQEQQLLEEQLTKLEREQSNAFEVAAINDGIALEQEDTYKEHLEESAKNDGRSLASSFNIHSTEGLLASLENGPDANELAQWKAEVTANTAIGEDIKTRSDQMDKIHNDIEDIEKKKGELNHNRNFARESEVENIKTAAADLKSRIGDQPYCLNDITDDADACGITDIDRFVEELQAQGVNLTPDALAKNSEITVPEPVQEKVKVAMNETPKPQEGDLNANNNNTFGMGTPGGM